MKHLFRPFGLSVMSFIALMSVVPVSADAATCPDLSPGDVFSVPSVSSAVYALNYKSERVYFPNSEVFHSWYADFSDVTPLDPSCVAAYPAAESFPAVGYRPGSVLIKTPNDPAVYAVGPDHLRMKLEDETVAADIYGASWASLVRDISEAEWTSYIPGPDITSGIIPEGTLVERADDDYSHVSLREKLLPVIFRRDSLISGDSHVISSDLFDGYYADDASFLTEREVIGEPSFGSSFDQYTSYLPYFTFEYPMSWITSEEYVDDDYGATDIELRSPRHQDTGTIWNIEEGENDNWYPVSDVTVYYEPAVEGDTEDSYVESIMNEGPADDGFVNVLTDVRLPNGIRAVHEVSTRDDAPENEIRYYEAYYFYNNGYLYSIVVQSYDDLYQGEQAVFDRIIHTISFPQV